MSSISELGIYIHIPFCKQKCAYCDFNSYAGMNELPNAYVNALAQEIERAAGREDIDGKKVISIYFGGGTPTFLDASGLNRILVVVKRNFSAGLDAEISIEANPETLDLKKLKALRKIGVNRLSLGFQSFQPRLLDILGRKHTAEEAVHGYHLARRAGFDNINIDLIFGIPSERLSDWKDTLRKVVELQPDHLSCYSLSIHHGTRLAWLVEKGKLAEVSEDEQAEMYEYACSYLKSRGLDQYEISNFSRPGKQCRHNLIYWKNGDYIGFGAGAHSHLNAHRWANAKHPKRYIEMMAEKGEAVVSRVLNSDRVEQSETIYMGLRLNTGLDLAEFECRFGCSLTDVYPEEIARLLDQRLVTSDQRLKLTPRGRLLANQVMSEFV